MAAQSPQPTAHRAFTILFAVLLVGSLLAPIAATAPAAAQGSDSIEINEDCGATAKLAFPRSCHAAEAVFGSVDTTQRADLIEVDVHTGAQAIYQGQQQRDSVYQNYLEDTETLASLEARNAIATAYENNKTAIEAQAAGQKAINDYYAHHQRQNLEMLAADSAEIAYYHNVTLNNSEISDDFISPWSVSTTDTSTSTIDASVNGTMGASTTLVNGSQYNYTTLGLDVYAETSTDSGSTLTQPLSVDRYRAEDGYFGRGYFGLDYLNPSNEPKAEWAGGFNVMNAPAASLNSTTVYDARLVAQRIHDIEQQAQTVQDNYPSGVAEDLYAKMDAGELSPSEVRGAEGMVRYLSGNETSGDNLEFALRHTLDLEQPDDLDGTMVVHFNGETDRERTTDSNGTVSYEYAAVNETYEGMLFASGFPNETAETGTTYQVSDFDGQPSMLVNGSELVMWSGEFTIQEMYDSDGNAVETAQYSGPEYGTYNATEYVQGLDNASDARAEIVENETDGGGGIGFPDNPFDGGGGGAFVGLVIVGALVVVVAVVVVVQSDS